MSFRTVLSCRSRIRSITGLLLCLACGNAVEPGLPSKTSIWTATGRAIGAKNPDAKLRNPDYLAIRFLGPRERAIIAADSPMDALDLEFEAATKRLPTDQDRGFGTAQFVRTKFLDEVLEQAITDGVQQAVILGAGFDSRGYWFKQSLQKARFLEVDYGRRRLGKVTTSECPRRKQSRSVGRTRKFP